MMWDGHDGMGWWMAWGSILWVVFILAIVFLAARLAGSGASRGVEHRHPESAPPREPPLDVARRRYAAGEITREEFEQIKRDLD